jgi:hypothetical protein
VHGVECPTCFNKFPVDEILQHADLCASSMIDWDVSNPNVMPEDSKLDELASELWDDDPIELHTHQSLINKAKENMETGQTIRINVTRKTLWDDFTRERARRLKPSKMLKVVFVDEPAIDDGGPRRELFSGNLCQESCGKFCILHEGMFLHV